MLGTPIQNKIEDLQSLMKIIRYQPFCDSNFWKASVGTKDGQKRVQVSKIRCYRLDNLIIIVRIFYRQFCFVVQKLQRSVESQSLNFLLEMS
jgi:SNF2 family DNA or RNA helicase